MASNITHQTDDDRNYEISITNLKQDQDYINVTNFIGDLFENFIQTQYLKREGIELFGITFRYLIHATDQDFDNKHFVSEICDQDNEDGETELTGNYDFWKEVAERPQVWKAAQTLLNKKIQFLKTQYWCDDNPDLDVKPYLDQYSDRPIGEFKIHPPHMKYGMDGICDIWKCDEVQLAEEMASTLAFHEKTFVPLYSELLNYWDMGHEVYHSDVISALINKYGWCAEIYDLIISRACNGQHGSEQIFGEFAELLDVNIGDFKQSPFIEAVVIDSYDAHKNDRNWRRDNFLEICFADNEQLIYAAAYIIDRDNLTFAGDPS